MSWAAQIVQEGNALVIGFVAPVKEISMHADAARRLAAGLLVAAAALEDDGRVTEERESDG